MNTVSTVDAMYCIISNASYEYSMNIIDFLGERYEISTLPYGSMFYYLFLEEQCNNADYELRIYEQ